MRDLEQLLTRDGLIPHHKRGQFNEYLNHRNERVRGYALKLEAADAWSRAEKRLYQDLDNSLEDMEVEEGIFLQEMEHQQELCASLPYAVPNTVPDSGESR